ncbi:MAG TPA: IclR family transcriptional regulator C-terminal domain-containing protein [Trebonia sp.]|nr:IclR family transcriptional regulator C-terminal domain-containing protein [Trebonia sp.]
MRALSTDVPAVSSAVRILERLAQAWPDMVTPGTLVSELGLNRSTCYNIVGTLQQAGWVSGREGRPGWTLGPRLLTITGVPDNVRLDVAQEEIEALSAELKFVVFLSARQPGAGHHVLAVAERSSGVRVTVSVGDTFPFSAPALMHASLAWTAPDEADRILDAERVIAFTAKTVTDREGLHRAFAKVRSAGYAESIQQFNMAQSGVAAPVFDSRGAVRYAVCSLAFSSELDETNAAATGDAIRRCAEAITLRTGGSLPDRYPFPATPQR